MTTPMLKQYKSIKSKYQNCILLFRLGDFYEAFYQDAKDLATTLDITLTSRGKGDDKIPMAGIPHHALENYMPKLVRAGLKVAIAEQLSEPGQGKIVERGVRQVVTPGTYANPSYIDNNKNIYISCIHIELQKTQKEYYISHLDITTGYFETKTLPNYKNLLNDIKKQSPAEILVSEKFKSMEMGLDNYIVEYIYESDFDQNRAHDILVKHFQTVNLKGFGLASTHKSIIPAGVLLRYVRENEKSNLNHITSIKKESTSTTMDLDFSTIYNLEILSPIRATSEDTSLFSELNTCRTSMGSRCLRDWLLNPLISKPDIEARQNIVSVFIEEKDTLQNIREDLELISDIERLTGRLGSGNINPKDLLALQYSLENTEEIHKKLNLLESLAPITQNIAPKNYKNIIEKIKNSIHEDPPTKIENGNVIKPGHNAQLDELREIKTNAANFLTRLQEREKKATGVTSLKVKFNKVFGYYIEISKANIDKVPDHYVRKQTLTNAERFITEELKEFEEKILTAEEKILNLETNLFVEIVNSLMDSIPTLQRVARCIAQIDVLSSFAQSAIEKNYTKPKLQESGGGIKIENGRHPVVERIKKEYYIPNNIILSKDQNFIVLTGPNMSGKSTYIRMLAILTIMSQVGMYIPASGANISIVDNIYTRVGASDNIAEGESTFMVEMSETAFILNNSTKNSLIILDEIGRGTSTYDGVALAWAISEFICDTKNAKTLFATHYHELISLEDKYKNVANYHVDVLEKDNKIFFSHKIKRGSIGNSYGVHVAKMAGIPNSVTKRAEDLLQQFEKNKKQEKTTGKNKKNTISPQIPLFDKK